MSRLSNGNDDNEVKQGTVLRFTGIYFTAEENYEKPQLGDLLQPVISHIGFLFKQ